MRRSWPRWEITAPLSCCTPRAGRISFGRMSPLVSIRKPPRLRKGDRVRLVAPASPFDRKLMRQGCERIRSLGLEPVVDREEFQRRGFLAGTDRSRAMRLVAALHEEQSKAVWFIRGGYGSCRVLDLVRPNPAAYPPKLLIGFSDITFLLMTFAAPGGFVTVHGPVVTQLPRLGRSSFSWLKKLLFDDWAEATVPLGNTRTIRGGRVRGFLYGGNLSIIASMAGTGFLPPLAGSILFIEDTGEPAYRLDRMLMQLKCSGAFENVMGVVVGRFEGCSPAGGRYSARRVVEDFVAEMGIPAISNAGFGHGRVNTALPIGLLAELDADRGRLDLLEPAFR
ncbi:MAG: LD-carboxypeptidase [Deltaproteobacteria bacterium]|nr:MAG: LD-carboxypeptidase [Deltaproteobacteria bacterium]